MESEDYLKEKLQSLQKQLAKKQTFEEAVASIRSILTQHAPSASPSLCKSVMHVFDHVFCWYMEKDLVFMLSSWIFTDWDWVIVMNSVGVLKLVANYVILA